MEEDIEKLQHELSTAKKEIANLRFDARDINF
jgi:ribosomal protein L29